jgi:hypothetical protein
MLGNPQSQEEDQKTKATYANTFMSFQDPDALAAQEAKAQQVANMNRNLAVAQLDPRQAPVFFAGQAGDAVAGGLNKFFGNSQDTPTVAKARMEAGAIKNALETTKGIGDRKERFKAIGDYLMDNGLQSRAQEAYARYQELVDSELKATQTRAKIGEINADTRKKGLEGDQLVPKEVYRQSLIKLGYPVPAIDKAMETYDPATGRTGSPKVLQQRLGDSVYGALEPMIDPRTGVVVKDPKTGAVITGQKILSGPNAGEYKMFNPSSGVNITNVNQGAKNEVDAVEQGLKLRAALIADNKGINQVYTSARAAKESLRQAMTTGNSVAIEAALQQVTDAVTNKDMSNAEQALFRNPGSLLTKGLSVVSRGLTGELLLKQTQDLYKLVDQIEKTAGEASTRNKERLLKPVEKTNLSGTVLEIAGSGSFVQDAPDNRGASVDQTRPILRAPVQREETAKARRASDVPRPVAPAGAPKAGTVVAYPGGFKGVIQPDGSIKVQ